MIFVYRFMKNRSIHIKYQHVPSPSQSPSPSSSPSSSSSSWSWGCSQFPRNKIRKGATWSVSLLVAMISSRKKLGSSWSSVWSHGKYGIICTVCAMYSISNVYIYIPLICQLHTIYKLKIYINHLRFYVIFHNCLPLTLMWPRQIHTHIYTYIQYIYI